MKKKSTDNSKEVRERFTTKLLYLNGKFDVFALLKNILISLGGGVLVFILGLNTIHIYDTLNKPIFTPPNVTFPIVGGVVYIIIGIAAYRIYMNNKLGRNDFGGYFYYLIVLLLNFLWSLLFFGLRLYGLSFILIIILLIFIMITIAIFLKVDKISVILMIPYGLWISFVALLNFFIWFLNEM